MSIPSGGCGFFVGFSPLFERKSLEIALISRLSRWQVRDSNPRRLSRLIYSQIPLAARVTCQGAPDHVLQHNRRRSHKNTQRLRRREIGGGASGAKIPKPYRNNGRDLCNCAFLLHSVNFCEVNRAHPSAPSKDAMPGIDAVAELAGVSTATVSRALSGNGHVSPSTRLRVHEAAATLGYVVSSPASSLASGRTKNVGVVVPFLSRWFYSSVLEGAGSALLQHGYDLTLYGLTGGAAERRSVFEHFLLRKRVDAVLALTIELTGGELQSLLDLKKPIVGIGGPLSGVQTLSIDDVAVATLATEHLLGLGHRRIGMIGGTSGFELDFHLPTNRRAGYECALRAGGVEPDPALFLPADFTIRGGYEAARELLRHAETRPTAIFAASDEMAIGSILAARDLGLDVPIDVSVIGIDGHEHAEFFGLTTVAQFPERQGARAVEMLMDQLHPGRRDPAPANIPLPVELIARTSTTAPLAG